MLQFNSREDIIALTPLWKGERFPDGRPRVPDRYLEALREMTLEELWKPIFVQGYENQFISMKSLYPEFDAKGDLNHKLIGRAVTAVYAPTRPDYYQVMMDTAAAQGWSGTPNQWVIESLTDGDVIVIDMYDKMQYILDSNAKDVAAFHDTLSFHYEVEDSSTVMMRMENGCQCVVQSNFNVPDEAAKWRIEIFGDRGRLLGYGVIGQEDGGTLDAMFLGEQGGYVAQQDTNKAVGETIEVEFGNAYAREIESFSNSLLTGAALEVPAQQAVQVQRIMEAAYQSNDEKITVTM